MKISEQEKVKTRIKILESAVDVISEKGFKSASMREIARHAGVGDATIYNYFPTKEKLLYGYCEYIQHQVIESLQAIDNFHEYSLHEQLQQLVDTELTLWLPAREFLQEVFNLTYYSPAASMTHLTDTKELFTQMVSDMLEAAIEVNEIPEQPYHDILPRLFWDYQTAVLAYWLKDDSEGFTNTTQMVDKSMEIIANVLQQGLIGKSLDLISFFFRTHVMRHMDHLAETKETVNSIKRAFMNPQSSSPKSKTSPNNKYSTKEK